MTDSKLRRVQIRVDDKLYQALRLKARAEGTTLAEVVRDMLEDYADDRPVADDLKRALKRLDAIHKRLKTDVTPGIDLGPDDEPCQCGQPLNDGRPCPGTRGDI